jgi:hypothetical protein
MIKRLALPDGSKVGIAELDSILQEVIALKLSDAEAIKAELLRRVREHNYVAPTASGEYAAALLREYEVRLGKAAARTEVHKHTAG